VPHETAIAETELILAADLVCATSSMLAEGSRELNASLLYLPNAVDFPAFVPAPRSAAERVSIGYVGALGPWFHTAAVREAARRHPDWGFRLAGEVEDPAVAALSELPNVELLGEIPFREVPPFLAGLDVAVVPFRDLPLTRAVDPVKLYEALAMGLPVVARRLPETERWAEPLVYLYDSAEGFVRQLERSLAERTRQLAGERRQLAEGESWDCRSGELLKTVATLPHS
jgi:glycosyltransferase involved in cell wall biosynthesis